MPRHSHTGRSAVDAVQLACAPIHKVALATAVGVTAGLLLFALTLFHVWFDPPEAPDLNLLAQYLPGYEVSSLGAVIGGAWAALVGFIGGWLLGAVRNVAVRLWTLAVATRAELRQTADFLDHL